MAAESRAVYFDVDRTSAHQYATIRGTLGHLGTNASETDRRGGSSSIFSSKGARDLTPLKHVRIALQCVFLKSINLSLQSDSAYDALCALQSTTQHSTLVHLMCSTTCDTFRKLVLHMMHIAQHSAALDKLHNLGHLPSPGFAHDARCEVPGRGGTSEAFSSYCCRSSPAMHGGHPAWNR